MSNQSTDDSGARDAGVRAERARTRRDRDDRWLDQAKRGDADAYRQLVAEWTPGAFDRALHRGADERAATDAVLHAFNSLQAQLTDDDTSFGARVMGVIERDVPARPRSLGKAHRGAKRAAERLTRGTDAHALGADPYIGVMLWDALDVLGDRARDITDLHWRHGLEADEIAAATGETVVRVDDIIRKAPQGLAAALRTRLLWSGGKPDHEDLARDLKANNVRQFDSTAVRVIHSHLRNCSVCRSRSLIALPAIEILEAVPLVALPNDVERRIAATSWAPFVAGGVAAATLAEPTVAPEPTPAPELVGFDPPAPPVELVGFDDPTPEVQPVATEEPPTEPGPAATEEPTPEPTPEPVPMTEPTPDPAPVFAEAPPDAPSAVEAELLPEPEPLPTPEPVAEPAREPEPAAAGMAVPTETREPATRTSTTVGGTVAAAGAAAAAFLGAKAEAGALTSEPDLISPINGTAPAPTAPPAEPAEPAPLAETIPAPDDDLGATDLGTPASDQAATNPLAALSKTPPVVPPPVDPRDSGPAHEPVASRASERKDRPKWLIPAGIAAAAVILLGLVLVLTRGGSDDKTAIDAGPVVESTTSTRPPTSTTSTTAAPAVTAPATTPTTQVAPDTTASGGGSGSSGGGGGGGGPVTTTTKPAAVIANVTFDMVRSTIYENETGGATFTWNVTANGPVTVEVTGPGVSSSASSGAATVCAPASSCGLGTHYFSIVAKDASGRQAGAGTAKLIIR